MDRFVAMLLLLGVLVTLILMLLALFAVAPVICSCLFSLVYTVYLFMAYEESGVHHAQEFENRFWTILALLFSTALFFAGDSPVAFGIENPSFGFVGVVLSSYAMHLWDRHAHRMALSRQTKLRRSSSFAHGSNANNIPVEQQLARIEECLRNIDQLLIPSTINNFINERFVLQKEREIINIFLECDAVALNHLVNHVRLGLLIYKIKDHHNFAGQHRTQLTQLLAVDRLPALTSISRVIVLHALQMLKLRANPRAEQWVRNIILNSHGDDLSDIKTLTDAKGDYFCMNKLIYDDIKSETVRQDILSHIRREATVQQAHQQMMTKRARKRQHMAWRKVLSDVDDTLLSSGGVYPAGIDKKYSRKVVYPGVLAFYRELDLGTRGPEEWPEHRVGNLVFLSARPHVYKDMSEKSNFAKFEKLRVAKDGRAGMHTVPSLLAGDLASGSHFIATNDCEPLAAKKFSNFQRYVSIYPEYKHVFVCDNGQGDVRAGELMFDAFPYEFEALYVHTVKDVSKTYGFAPERWRDKEFKPVFFRTYPEAALHAASCEPPLIRISGLRRVCMDAVKDFNGVQPKQWTSRKQKADRRGELNQSLSKANDFLIANNLPPVDLIPSEQEWQQGTWINTPYGRGIVRGYDANFDMYDVELDWRPLDVQIKAHLQRVKEEAIRPRSNSNKDKSTQVASLETVLETDETNEDEPNDRAAAANDTESLRRRDRSSSQSDSKTSDGKTSSKDRGRGSAVANAPSFDQNKTGDEPENSGQVNPLRVISSTVTDGDYGKAMDHLTTVNEEEDTDAPTRSSIDGNDTQTDANADANGSVDVDVDIDIDPKPLASTTTVAPAAIRSSKLKTTLRIRGRCISRYTPPKLSEPSKKSSLFSFWTAETSSKPKSESKFKTGDKCSTPYGAATIVKHRISDSIVEVTMTGWPAKAYLQEDQIRPISQGIFSSIFRRQSSSGLDNSTKPAEFPYIKGTIIQTPYGEASVVRPLPLPPKSGNGEHSTLPTATSKPAVGAPSSSLSSSSPPSSSSVPVATPPAATPTAASGGNNTSASAAIGTTAAKPDVAAKDVQTIGLKLTSWKLKDGSHPMLYCTVEQAERWKSPKHTINSRSSDGILSAFGSLVTTTLDFASILGTSQRNTRRESEVDTPKPKYRQYYQDSASVSTSYGDGVVKKFRDDDGIYEVHLTKWKLGGDKTCAVAYIQQNDVSHRIAKGCQEGYPVYTYLGLTGVLESVEPTTGVHLVTCKSAGMVMYLQPDAVIQPLKAAVGEEVLTAYGDGIVESYSFQNNMYTIKLNGWGAKLYAVAETFDRVESSMRDRDGAFGMNWLVRIFFSSSLPDKPAESTRSRSNSLVSAVSMRSQSARSTS